MAMASKIAPLVRQAVGDGFNSSETEIPVAEAWNGKTWSIKAVPS
jgi:hypothetical protein